MIQVLNDFINQNYKGIAVNINANDVAMIVPFPGCTYKNVLKGEREKLGLEIRKIFLNSIKYNTSIGVGGIYRDAAGIGKSFIEASEALQYRFILGKNRVILCDEVKAMRDKSYAYPFELQVQLVGLLKQGDLESVIKAHDGIFTAVVGCKGGHRDITHYYFMQLLSSVIKAIFDIGINIECMFSVKNLYEDLLQCKDESAIDEWFRNIYRKTCEQIEQRKNSKNHGIADTVARYVRGNYNKDLSLYILSQQV